MKQAFIRWMCDEAAPWEFWKPRSGISGGALVGAVITAACYLMGWLP